MYSGTLAYRLLADLIDELEKKGHALSPDKWLQVQQLWQNLPADTPAEKLRTLLAPILVTGPEEQQQFYDLFDQCLQRARSVTQEQDSPVHQQQLQQIATLQKAENRWRWIALTVPLLLAGLTGFWWSGNWASAYTDPAFWALVAVLAGGIGLAWRLMRRWWPAMVYTILLPAAAWLGHQARNEVGPEIPTRIPVYLTAAPGDTTAASLLWPGDTARLLGVSPSEGSNTPAGSRFRVDSLGNALYIAATDLQPGVKDSVSAVLFYSWRVDTVPVVVSIVTRDSSVVTPVDTGLLAVSSLPFPYETALGNLVIKAPAPIWLFLKQYEWPLKLLLLLLAGLLAWSLVKWDRYRRARVVAELIQPDRPPYLWQPDIQEQAAAWSADAAHPLLNRLKARTRDDGSRLDTPATIRATIRQGGKVCFVYKARTLPPDYLFLIDRLAWNDHRSQLFETLYQAFLKAEAPVTRYFYDGDPRLCFDEAHPHGITLGELLHRNATAHLVLVGEGHALLSQESGKAAPWTKLLLSWKKRALLSPKPTQAWGRQEKQLSEILPVLPASPDGLGATLDLFQAVDPLEWSTLLPRIKDATVAPLTFSTDLIADLQRAYKPPVVDWIAACALWPTLHWDLTCYLGRALSPPGVDLLSFENLRDLVRLPWFVMGRIPEGARALLLDYLDERGLHDKARQALQQLLHTLPAPPAYAVAYEDYRMNILLNELMLRPDKETRRRLEREFENYLKKGKKPDFVALRLLDRPATRFDALVSQRLKKWAFKEGLPGLGWKLAPKLLALWVLLAAGIALIPLKEKPACTGETRLYKGQERCLQTPEDQLLLLQDEVADAVKAQQQGKVDSLLAEADRLNLPDTSRSKIYQNAAAHYYNAGASWYNCSIQPGPTCPQLSPDSLKNLACAAFRRADTLLRAQQLSVPVELYNALQKACPVASPDDTSVVAPLPIPVFAFIGRVVDNLSGQPIAGASVRLGDAGRYNSSQLPGRATTDRQGNYQDSLRADEAGNQLLLYVQAEGYDDFSLRTSPRQNLPLVRLNPTAATLEALAWAKAETTNTAAAYAEYLQGFPNGAHADEAQRRQSNMAVTQDQAAWDLAAATNTIAAYEAYLKQYPTGAYAAEATRRINDLLEEQAWQTTQQTNTPAACQSYLNRYPNGKYAAEARACATPPPPPAITEPEMVLVRGGTFTMGCEEKRDGDCYDREKPTHSVTLSNYYIGRYEVTNAQFAIFLNDYGTDKVKAGAFAGQEMIGEHEWGLQKQGQTWAPAKGYENHPVIYVRWYGANEYAGWLRQRTGKAYRLPTEAEWEYAARGGAGSQGYKYSGSDKVGEVAWYIDNSGSTTHPVGQKKPNELGLYDMSGNVWEWCNDWYAGYTAPSKTNPKGPDNGENRVLRGGSWNLSAPLARVAYRGVSAPGFRYFDLGFRLAQDSR